MLIYSPLEQFEVVPLINLNIPLFGYLNLSLTNLAVYSLIVFTLVLFLHLAFKGTGSNDTKLIPSKWAIAFESSFASINAIVREQIGLRNEIYLPFIYSLFFFIIIANLIGNIPYSFAITTSIILSVGLSFTIFIGVSIIGLVKHGLHFFSFFIPAGTPLALVPLLVLIELTSYLARAVSLGVRLFANITAGHTLLKILSTFLFQLFSSSLIVAGLTLIPFSIFVALIGLEIGVSIIQSYVFILLTSSYIKDSLTLH
uniref:ATP synthase F0 subunit a n=1 Tax=Ramaria rubella TaxID=113071 RepID=UPI0022385DD8|nr:ATP synthase F0 subunit a [Ramaria rubella]UYR22259.1 ATP synthase F0 subunit a [Ramaria rubella]